MGFVFAAARGHIGDRAGADEKIQRAFVIPAHDGMAEMRSSAEFCACVTTGHCASIAIDDGRKHSVHGVFERR
jgi:hypothetical protein